MTKCKKHPRYKAIQRPRCECAPCERMYAERTKGDFESSQPAAYDGKPESLI